MNCLICNRADAAEINAKLMARVTERAIAIEFGLKKSSVHVHKVRCVQAAIEKAAAARQIVLGDTLLDMLDFLAGKAIGVIERAETRRKDELLLRGIASALEVLRTRAEMTGMKPGAKGAPAPRVSYNISFVGGRPIAQEVALPAVIETEGHE